MRSCVDNPVPAPQAQRHSPRHKALTVTATPHPTPMKVLLLHNRYRQPGGEDRVAAAEASLLRRHGIRVIEPDFENAIAARGRLRQTFELAAQSAWSADSYQRVRKLCELHRPDVAHVHNFWLRMSPSVHAACRDAGVPTVQSLHNYRIVCVNALLLRNGTVCEACVGKVPWRGAVRRCYRGSFWASAAAAGMIVTNRLRGTWTHQAAALVTPSTHSRGKLLAAGLPRDRIFVKPNSVDDPGEPPSAPSTSDSAVFLGRLSPEKGVDVLLRAWARSKLGVLPAARDRRRRSGAGWLGTACRRSWPPIAGRRVHRTSRPESGAAVSEELPGSDRPLDRLRDVRPCGNRGVFARPACDRLAPGRVGRTRRERGQRIERQPGRCCRLGPSSRPDPGKCPAAGHSRGQRAAGIPRALHAAKEFRESGYPLYSSWRTGAWQ